MADVGDQDQTHDAPTAPFRKIVLPSTDETVTFPKVQRAAKAEPQAFPEQGRPALPPFPPPLPPPKSGLLSRIGDIPIKVVYLLGAILATVLAVLLVFVIFPGDVPSQSESEPVVPVPSAVSASVPPSGGAPVAMPAAPVKQAFAKLPGKAGAVSGTIIDSGSGISYPRLGKPWSARSYPPFSVAQRVGKVAVPQTVIASAMLPGDIETKPSKDADYRELAVQAARWTLRTQYPKGATLAWTGSQKTAGGKGWALGFEVTYTHAGKQQQGRALVAVLEVGKTKPAMLMASIPAAGKAYWADLKTLVTKVRPL